MVAKEIGDDTTYRTEFLPDLAHQLDVYKITYPVLYLMVDKYNEKGQAIEGYSIDEQEIGVIGVSGYIFHCPRKKFLQRLIHKRHNGMWRVCLFDTNSPPLGTTLVWQ